MKTETPPLLHPPAAEMGEAAPLHVVVDQYCAIRYGDVVQGRAAMEENYRLLEPLRGENEIDEVAEKPAMTIVIPDAVLSESDETILRVVGACRRAENAFGKPVEIVLWSNGTDDTNRAPALAANYQQRRDKLTLLASEGLQIKTALQPNPQGSKTISQIRADFMEAVAIDALQADQAGDYPIVWLDADTTFLSSNAFTDIADALEQNLAPFIHATEQFTTEWADGKPLNERDLATRAIMIAELHRRKYAKLMADRGKRIGYIEESGLAFKLRTYLELGGVNTDDPVNEVSNLVGYAKGLVYEGVVDRERSFAHTNMLYPEDEGVVAYLPHVKIGLSGRHIYKAVQDRGLEGIRRPQGWNQYSLHSGGGASTYDAKRPQRQTSEAPTIDAASVRGLVTDRMTTKYKLAAQTDANLSDHDYVIIDRVINRAFEERSSNRQTRGLRNLLRAIRAGKKR